MPRKKVSKKNTARWIRALQLRLPATSANLGPAFDAAAVALDLYLKLAAGPAAHFSITASGRDREVCENLENHLILNTYREVLSAQGREVTPLSLRIQNEISGRMYIMLTRLDASRIRVDPAHHRSDDWEFGAMWSWARKEIGASSDSSEIPQIA